MFPLISKVYHNFIYCLDQVKVSDLGNMPQWLLPLREQDFLSEKHSDLDEQPRKVFYWQEKDSTQVSTMLSSLLSCKQALPSFRTYKNIKKFNLISHLPMSAGDHSYSFVFFHLLRWQHCWVTALSYKIPPSATESDTILNNTAQLQGADQGPKNFPSIPTWQYFAETVN